MKRTEVLALNEALSNPSLKSSPLSGESYVKLLNVKRGIKKYIANLIEVESSFADDNGVERDERGTFIFGEGFDKKAFLKKFKDVQNSVEELKVETNFIEEKEFKEWTNNVDLNSATELYEHLGKKPLMVN